MIEARTAALAHHEATRRVLIVDDYQDVSEVLASELQMQGFHVTPSRSFEDAHEKLLIEIFDVLVTDVRLGEFNGIQLAVIAREKWPSMRIIVISGFDDSVVKAEATRLNATYLLKPVSPEHLVTILRSESPAE